MIPAKTRRSIDNTVYTVTSHNQVLDKHGRVGVAISPSYGAGWSSWNDQALATEPIVIFAILEHKYSFSTTEMEFLGRPYMGGFHECIVEWVNPGQWIRVAEYDGSESIDVVKEGMGFYLFPPDDVWEQEMREKKNADIEQHRKTELLGIFQTLYNNVLQQKKNDMLFVSDLTVCAYTKDHERLYHVHKWVLDTVSDYFRVVNDGRFQTQDVSRLQVPTLDSFEKFLCFAYTGKIDKNMTLQDQELFCMLQCMAFSDENFETKKK